MNQKIKELQQRLDLTLQSLPEHQRRRYLAEDAMSNSLIAANKFIISELIARASDRDVMFFDISKEHEKPSRLAYGIISVPELLDDTPEMRMCVGSYRNSLKDFHCKAADLGAVVLFIHLGYSQEFVDSCGAGANSLPVSSMRLINRSTS